MKEAKLFVISNWTRFSVRHRRLMLWLWVILIAATLPLALHVTKHLTTNGFERPHSQVQWATTVINQIHAPAAPQPLLIQHVSMSEAEHVGRKLYMSPASFHRIGPGKTLFIPSAGLTLTQVHKFRHALSVQHATSETVSQLAIGKLVTHDASQTLTHSGVLAMPVLAVLLLLVFGSAMAVTLPLIIAVSGAEVALAAVSIISRHMQLSVFLTDIVSFLALGVGVDYALFISTRFRQDLDDGLSVEDAVVDSMSHAGRSVLYSGIAVALAVATLVFGDNAYWKGLAVGGAVAIFSVLLATHTLLPAIMGLLGKNLHWGRIRRPDFRLWKRLSHWVTHHPVAAAIMSLVILVPFATVAPQIQMRTPPNLATMLPRSDPLREAVETQQKVQGAGAIAPIAIAVRLDGPLTNVQNWVSVARLTEHLRHMSDVASVSSPTLLPVPTAELALALRHPSQAPSSLRTALQNFVAPHDTRLLVVYVIAKSGPNAARTSDLVGHIDAHLHSWLPAGTRAAAGGLVPVLRSFNQTTSSRIPIIIASALAAALIVLTAATSSVVQALLGVVFDGLVALATAGFLVLADHHQWLGLERQPLDSSITPLIFVLLFGLSMDYEVILLHRMQERIQARRERREAIEGGLATTGAMITGAGMIMVVVFLALLISPLQVMKTLGIGLSFAVLADTWIVRSLLVPSTTTLLGRLGFWPWRAHERALSH